jgi:hypothetical protein
MVVLPQPDGPSRVKNSPLSTAKLTFFTASKSPKRRVMPMISRSAMVSLPSTRVDADAWFQYGQQRG